MNLQKMNAQSKHMFVHKKITFDRLIHIAIHGKSPLSKNQRASRKTDDRHFYETKTFDEAVSILKTGYDIIPLPKEVLAEIRAQVKNLLPSYAYEKHFTRKLVGGFVDISTVGKTPENFFEEETESSLNGSTRFIEVVSSVAYNANTEPETFHYRGRLVYEVVKTLVTLGFNVKLVGIEAIENNSNIYQLDIVLKDYNQDPRWNRIKIALCSAMFLRRFIFAYEECESLEIINMFGFKAIYSYGRHHKIVETSKDAIVFDFPSGITSKEAINEIVTNSLTKFKEKCKTTH
jgi:hypothetical protein